MGAKGVYQKLGSVSQACRPQAQKGMGMRCKFRDALCARHLACIHPRAAPTRLACPCPRTWVRLELLHLSLHFGAVGDAEPHNRIGWRLGHGGRRHCWPAASRHFYAVVFANKRCELQARKQGALGCPCRCCCCCCRRFELHQHKVGCILGSMVWGAGYGGRLGSLAGGGTRLTSRPGGGIRVTGREQA